jgi:hypothetical protein
MKEIRDLVEEIFKIQDPFLRKNILMRMQNIFDSRVADAISSAKEFRQLRGSLFRSEQLQEQNDHDQPQNIQSQEIQVQNQTGHRRVYDQERFELLVDFLQETLISRFGNMVKTYLCLPDIHDYYNNPEIIKICSMKNRKRWACNHCGALQQLNQERTVLSIAYKKINWARQIYHTFSFCSPQHLEYFMRIRNLKRILKDAKNDNEAAALCKEDCLSL